jgi:hypothetical protein
MRICFFADQTLFGDCPTRPYQVPAEKAAHPWPAVRPGRALNFGVIR